MKETYGLWQSILLHFPKAHRFTLGSKIDTVFLHAIEYSFLASYSKREEKLALLDRCIARIDLLKLLIELTFDIRAVDTKKYGQLAEAFYEILQYRA